ncbi:hypothetical protein [Terrabacter sp. C0L_2]|uniref:hypothetical protein n=1 Tax=Terrabacter sp. C0L_2 TaxID=3108389 RepID=UPI002ED64951|nr:hypothetical protein U5C87_05925 [Terrabacter sp. C0L_2]
MLATLAGAKLGATIAGIAVGLGGAATVVYVSSNVAHTPDSHASATATPASSGASGTSGTSGGSGTSGARTGTPTPQGTAVGPDATGSAAHGLCTARKAVAANGNGNGGKAMDSVAFTNLAKAAGGADKIASWCATVTAPGASGDHATGKPSSKGKPATVPTGKPATVPTGKPTTVPTGRPTTQPAGKPTVLPTPTATPPVTPSSHPAGRP